MKKLLGIVVLGLLWCTKAYSNEELYWCKNDTWGADVIHGIPVRILPQENKMIFLEELKFSNGNSWESAFERKDLKITKKTSAFYKAKKGKLDVIFYREYLQLLTKIKGVNKDFTEWWCKRYK